MKKYIKTVAYICMSMLSMSLIGMDTRTQALTSSQDNIPKVIMQAIKKGNYIFFDSYVFTHQEVGKEMQSKHLQGNVGRHSTNKHILTQYNQIKRFPDLHIKRVLISEKDPRVGTPGKTMVIDTSANLSYNTYHNLETAVTTEGDKEYFGQHFEDHQYVTRLFNKENRSPVKRTKLVIEVTPQKRSVYNSRHYHLSGSKIPRITKLLHSKNKNRVLYLTSMNWLNQDVTNAIIAVHKDGVVTKIIVNGTALKQGKKQLDAMHAAGVPIFVFDPEHKVRHAQHSKVLLRIDGQDALLVNSTANMTSQGDKEINIDCYHPQNMDAVLSMRKALDEYAAQKCIEYGKIK